MYTKKTFFTKPMRFARDGFNLFCVIVPRVGNENLIN